MSFMTPLFSAFTRKLHTHLLECLLTGLARLRSAGFCRLQLRAELGTCLGGASRLNNRDDGESECDGSNKRATGEAAHVEHTRFYCGRMLD